MMFVPPNTVQPHAGQGAGARREEGGGGARAQAQAQPQQAEKGVRGGLVRD